MCVCVYIYKYHTKSYLMATLVREDAAAGGSMMLHFSFLIRHSFGFMLKYLFHTAGKQKTKISHQHWRRQASVLDGEQRTNLSSWTAPGRSRAGMRATTHPAWFKAAAG